MSTLPKALTGLAAVAFVVAVITSFTGPLKSMPAHTFAHACTNLALLAIAVVLTGDRSKSSTS
jgi:hypothetical protein